MFRTRTFLSNGGLGAFGLIVIAFCYFTATQFELYASVNPCRGGNSHSPDPFPALGFIFVLGLLLSVYFRLYHSRPRSVEYLLLAFLLGLFVFRSFIPAWQSLNTDFRNYYVAARLFREKSSMLRVYDFTWFQRQKDHQGVQQCIVGYVPDTLLSALPIVPFAGLSPLTAKRWWLVINVVFLAFSALVLTQITQLGWRRVLIIIFLAVEPISTSFLYGQMHLFVFLLLAGAAWCSERNRAATSGMCVALAAGLKLYPAVFLIFFIRKKQWRALAGTAVGLLTLAALSIYLFGWDVHRIYLRQILPAIGRGENIDPYAAQWNSLTALLHRVLIAEPGLNPHPLVNAPHIYALIQPICQALIFLPAVWLLVPGPLPRAHARLEWAMFIAMLITLSTGPTPYHLCVLILSAALGLDSLLAEGRRREAYALALLYGMVCFPWPNWLSRHADGWHMFLASPRVYPLLALPFFLYGIVYCFPHVRERLTRHQVEKWAFGGAFLMLVVMGSLLALQHERGEFDNYRYRLLTLPSLLFQGEPGLGAKGLIFTRMPGEAPGFETWLQSGNRLTSLFVAEDEFHPSSAPALKDVWVESAGPVSNVVRVSNLAGVPISQIEVANGEEPSVSADGKWLAFIREYHGRGGLWIKDLASKASPQDGGERSVVQNAYDVWEAAFEPGRRRIIFTAAPDGRPELFLLDLASGRITAMAIEGPARYPAFSSDGEWLAYSRLEHGTWHVYVRNLKSVSTRRLVNGDCNSISPVWETNSKSLIYATDCGRGLEMTALARIQVAP